jgi:hypothetical protein
MGNEAATIMCLVATYKSAAEQFMQLLERENKPTQNV